MITAVATAATKAASKPYSIRSSPPSSQMKRTSSFCMCLSSVGGSWLVEPGDFLGRVERVHDVLERGDERLLHCKRVVKQHHCHQRRRERHEKGVLDEI